MLQVAERKSQPIIPPWLPSSWTFEFKDEVEVTPASMAVSKLHNAERGTVDVTTFGRKLKYSDKKKSESN